MRTGLRRWGSRPRCCSGAGPSHAGRAERSLGAAGASRMQSSGCSCLHFGHCSCPAPTAQPTPIPPPCRDLASRTLPSRRPRLTCPAPPPRCSSPSEPAPKSAFTLVLLTSCLQQPTILRPLPGTGTCRAAEVLTGPAAPPHPADTTLGSKVRGDGATLQHRNRGRGCTRCSEPHREA